jgi:hypothetical protein
MMRSVLAAVALSAAAIFAAGATGGAPNATRSAFNQQVLRVRPKLVWVPPRLVRPKVIRLEEERRLFLDPKRDYIIRLSRDRPLIAHNVGCIWIRGGHNVVIIGGECYADRTSGQTEGNGRAVYIEGNTGTVHVEGLWAHGPGLTEGVDLFSHGTKLQLENCRFDHLTRANDSHIHSDLIQADSAWAVRVDRFTGSSEVQGFFRDGDAPARHGADFRHVNISKAVPGSVPARALWQDDAFWYPMSLTAFYLIPLTGRTVGNSVWPGTDDANFPAQYRAFTRRDGSIAWPPAAHIKGVVRRGSPPHGDFVPPGVAGLRYVSSGYQRRPWRR